MMMHVTAAIDFFISLIGIGAISFAATNIDDIFLLMIFFSSPNLLARNVVIGQYLGIGLLVAISALGSLIALVVPSFIIGLMGLAPIAIGVKKLLELRADDKNEEVKSREKLQGYSKKLPLSYLSFLSVSAVTFSNGGDNIGVYTPLFAKYSSAFEVATLVSVFMAMTAVWCAIGYYLVSHPLFEKYMRRFGQVVLPFVLIGLGVYIMADAFLF
jgi:cadmium resistance protein CadD (predicted permease)